VAVKAVLDTIKLIVTYYSFLKSRVFPGFLRFRDFGDYFTTESTKD